jgi:hypothetical protein
MSWASLSCSPVRVSHLRTAARSLSTRAGVDAVHARLGDDTHDAGSGSDAYAYAYAYANADADAYAGAYAYAAYQKRITQLANGLVDCLKRVEAKP